LLGLLVLVWETLKKAILARLLDQRAARCGENSIFALLRNQRLAVVDFGGTSLCRGKRGIDQRFLWGRRVDPGSFTTRADAKPKICKTCRL
jgi:hypothetical protein